MKNPEEAREKAKLAKLAMVEAAKEFTKPSKEDVQFWKALAKHYKIRLPANYVPSTTKHIAKYIRKLELDRTILRDYFGEGWKLSDFNELHPNKGAVFFVGNLLEIKLDQSGVENIDRFYQ